MKPSLLILCAAGILVAASSALSAASQTAPAGKPRQVPLYGHVQSIVRQGNGYLLRFDPAWWLTGSAAEHACGCKPVPNDYYVVDETHRLLTLAVRRDARVTVLVRGGGPVGTAQISVAELAQIVKGRNPRHRRLLEPKAGFWVRIGEKYPNPAVSLDQQYQP